MSDGGAYFPFRSILLVLTHDFIITCVCGPTGSDGHELVIRRRRWLRTTFVAVCGDGGGVSRGPHTTTSFGPQHEPPLARLVLYRQTSAQNGVRGSSDEVGHISVFMHPATLAVDNGRAPHFRARHGQADAREGGRYAPVSRVLGSEPLSLRTHRHRGRSWPLRSAVVEYQAPSVAV